MEPEFLSPQAVSAVAAVPKLSAPVSVEALHALHPTVVLGTEDIPQHQPELEHFQASIWIDPVGLEGLWSAVGQVGVAINAPTSTYLAALKDRVPEPVAGDLPVFFFDCCDPPFTMGGRAPLTELLLRMGARNVFAELDQDWMRVSWEAVLVATPKLVVIDDYNGEGDASAKLAVVREKFGEIPTVVLPLGLALEGPRTLDAIDILRPAIEGAR
jgi:ABC-type Fe3+-hydroxamate transport system substrate-binding protein